MFGIHFLSGFCDSAALLDAGEVRCVSFCVNDELRRRTIFQESPSCETVAGHQRGMERLCGLGKSHSCRHQDGRSSKSHQSHLGVVEECEVEERAGTPGSVENHGEESQRTGLQK